MFGLRPPVMFASLSISARGAGLGWTGQCPHSGSGHWLPGWLRQQRTVPEVTSDPGANILKTILKKNELTGT